MNIFSEVKEQLTTRQVAESYGLRIRKNGVACCPFHDDRHPSMKVDKNYHCFACGVGGDVIDYTVMQVCWCRWGSVRLRLPRGWDMER